LRDNYTSDQYDYFLFKVNSTMKRETIEVMKELRMRVVDNPNFTSEFLGFKLHNLKLKQVMGLAYGSWIIPQELGIMLQLDLQEYIKRYDLNDRIILEILLTSKGHAQKWLLETDLWHFRDFFGNILPIWIRTINRLSFRPVNKKLRKPQRKRGYHDHGTLNPSHKWLPSHDWSLTEEQNQIEMKRNIFQDTLNFLRGWFE